MPLHFTYRKDIQKRMQARIDVTMAVETVMDVIRKIILKKAGPCIGTEKFNSTDKVTSGYLKTHFLNKQTIFCSSWISEDHTVVFLDKIHCGPPPMKWVKVVVQDYDSTGTYFNKVLVSDRDIFPTDQDVFRLAGDDWTVYAKGTNNTVVKSGDESEWIGHAPGKFYDVIVDGNMESLIDDMLMYKLVGFEFL